MKIVNLTTRAVELTGGALLTAGGGADPAQGILEDFTPGNREHELQRAGKIALILEDGEPAKLTGDALAQRLENLGLTDEAQGKTADEKREMVAQAEATNPEGGH